MHLGKQNMASRTSVFLSLILVTIGAFTPFASISHSASSSASTPSAAAENSTLFALLAFKASLVYPPRSPLYSWSTSSHFCTWTGVVCASGSHEVTELFLDYEHLNGTLSPQIANLQELSSLCLSGNLLFGQPPSSLAQLQRLKYLNLSWNQFSGALPSFFGQMENLRYLDLSGNQFSGPLPSSYGQMKNLTNLYLSNNQLFGPLPSSYGQLKSLINLYLSSNQLSGPLPSSYVQNMTRLQHLKLSQNRLSGTLPPSLELLTSLTSLDLSRNQLLGPLPPSLGLLTSLTSLDLSRNQLSGSLPPSLGQMQSLQYLNLSHNELFGHLPSSLVHMIHLSTLKLQHNQLFGSFPSFIGQMETLDSLDLSYNQLSGPLPMSLDSLVHLSVLDVSYNQLEGSIPPRIYHRFSLASFMGNPSLHASFPFASPPAPKDHAKRSILLVIVPLVGAVCLSTPFCVWWYCVKRRDLGLNFVAPQYKAWTIEEMRVATNNFDAANVIGSGAVSMCYLGTMELAKGTRAVALKRLIVHDYDGEDDGARESFVNEFKTICKVRHRNVVKVLGYCVEQGEVALVMDYMEGGDLDMRLHNEANKLSWEEKVNVALDIAEGLVYLHHEYDQPIIHCDIKPKNILLTLDMVAKISDFGIAKLMGANERGDMSMSKLRGSFGYIAPEYGMGLRISTKVDVYSFGVLLMELVTEVRPTSSMLENEAMSLRTWVETLEAFEHVRKVLQVHDNATLQEAKELLRLGVQCTHDVAKERPTMYAVRDFILQLKTKKVLQESIIVA